MVNRDGDYFIWRIRRRVNGNEIKWPASWLVGERRQGQKRVNKRRLQQS